ncbi:MAG: phosphoribosyl-ATP diphosphatase [Parvularculaceae bacterium]
MHRNNDGLGAIMARVYETIRSRRNASPASSYTAALLKAGPERCAKKFGEEAVEAAIAGAVGAKKELAAESADALYHLLVLLAAAGVTPADVARELEEREGVSGHAEKAARR